jgi:HPt (histidine-containing phosphotransfer) domain-containing protein
MTNAAIDFEHLARQTDGDQALASELLTLFAAQCLRQLQTIRGHDDAGTRRDAAHTLRGAAQAIGAWSVAEAAAVIENQLGQPEGRCTEAALESLDLAAAEARAAIARSDPRG